MQYARCAQLLSCYSRNAMPNPSTLGNRDAPTQNAKNHTGTTGSTDEAHGPFKTAMKPPFRMPPMLMNLSEEEKTFISSENARKQLHADNDPHPGSKTENFPETKQRFVGIECSMDHGCRHRRFVRDISKSRQTFVDLKLKSTNSGGLGSTH